MKSIIIFKYGDGELANQLWNYVSIYAYGLEKGVPVFNPSFYEYHSSFKFLEEENGMVKSMAKLFEDYFGRKQKNWKKFWRKIYRIYPFYIYLTQKSRIISSDKSSNSVVALPPTGNIETFRQKEDQNKVYFDGWLFRNPVGLNKYRKEIISAFCPRDKIVEKVHNRIAELAAKYEKIVGIHIRQGDYVTFKDGHYLIPADRVRTIIDEYIKRNSVIINKTVFVIASDGPIEPKIIQGLNCHISKENAVTDLFLLSACDVVIGSNSSFGDFAAWYGNIPHIIMTKETIDWEYYDSKKEYFENKFCTMVHYR